MEGFLCVEYQWGRELGSACFYSCSSWLRQTGRGQEKNMNPTDREWWRSFGLNGTSNKYGSRVGILPDFSHKRRSRTGGRLWRVNKVIVKIGDTVTSVPCIKVRFKISLQYWCCNQIEGITSTINNTTVEDGRDQRPNHIITSSILGGHRGMDEILVWVREPKFSSDSRWSENVIGEGVRSQIHGVTSQHLKERGETGRDSLGGSQND